MGGGVSLRRFCPGTTFIPTFRVQVQKQIVGIAIAQDLRVKAQGWTDRNSSDVKFRNTWRSLRRKHRNARTALLTLPRIAVRDLDKSTREITSTRGIHDVKPAPDTSEHTDQGAVRNHFFGSF